jgi:hypothetical protein
MKGWILPVVLFGVVASNTALAKGAPKRTKSLPRIVMTRRLPVPSVAAARDTTISMHPDASHPLTTDQPLRQHLFVLSNLARRQGVLFD